MTYFLVEKNPIAILWTLEFESIPRNPQKRSFRQTAGNLSCNVRVGAMIKHRIVITSYIILILFVCFTPQSEGRSFCPLGKIFGGLLCNKWYADLQYPLTNLFCNNLQYDDTYDFTLFCNRLNNSYHHDEIFRIHEKRCVLSEWIQYTGASQRPPPFSSDQLYI